MEPIINWHSFFFLFFALVTCCFAVAVVVAGNVVRMACYLVVSLGAVSGLFFLAGADFVGAMQLMIYVGGTMVLLVFGVMLTAKGPFVSLETGAGNWILAVLIGGSLVAILVQTLVSVDDWFGPEGRRHEVAHTTDGNHAVDAMHGAPSEAIETKTGKSDTGAHTATPIGLGLLGVRVDKLSQENERLRGGMSGYLLPFEIVSVHLLVVLIGAAYLARARRRGSEISEKDLSAELRKEN